MAELTQSISKTQLAALFNESDIDLPSQAGVTFDQTSGVFQGTEAALEQMLSSHKSKAVDLYFDGAQLEAGVVKDKTSGHVVRFADFSSNGQTRKVYDLNGYSLEILKSQIIDSGTEKAKAYTDVLIAETALQEGFGHLTGNAFDAFIKAADTFDSL